MANFNPATFDPSSMTDAELAQYLGIQQPELDQTQEQAPPQGLGSQIVSGFSGLENQNYGPLQGFGQGLVAGLSKGLGAAGTRAAENQARMEQMILERQKQRNQLNLQATQNYRESLQKGRQQLLTEQRAAANKPAPETPEQIRQKAYSEALGRAQGAAAGPRSSDEASALALTPAGLDAAAQMYARTGNLPPMGISKATAGVRTKIINRAAEMFPNLDIASNKAGYESNKAALTNLRKLHTASGAFEATAVKNADRLLALMKKISDTGSPLLNRPIRAIEAKTLGSADLAAYKAARETVAPEFARLLAANPSGSGTLSDSAREEIRHIIDGDYSLSQMTAAINTLKAEATGRRASYDDAIRQIEHDIASGGASGAAQDRTRPPLDSIVEP